MYEGITFEDFLKVGGLAQLPARSLSLAPLTPGPLQMWQGIDIETKMHVRFLNMETIAHCY